MLDSALEKIKEKKVLPPEEKAAISTLKFLSKNPATEGIIHEKKVYTEFLLKRKR